ncbi:hypothetical protein [Paenibacillus lutrae]|uniref:Uncharacterized protein n=1 Tax=Paenibacillus lutrae TaxID=2078573 RepID=A0A7X3K1H6_9BACL|nr:hypothetical protein [Paenibacillus lutrae]MVP02125.1 hypothetical protein [Paenibacillus lutrae]
MKDTTLRALYLWLALIIIAQPLISYKDYLLEMLVKENTAYITEKAAPEGMVTPSLRQELITNLTKVGFTHSQISITYSNAVANRKQRLDVTVKADRPPMFLYNFSSLEQPKYYYAHSYTMSEYLD